MTDDTRAELATTAARESVRGIRIRPDGTIDLVDLPRTADGGIGDGLRAALGCDRFATHQLDDHLDMWHDEEAGERVPVNTLANKIVWSFYKGKDFDPSWWRPDYRGTVVFLDVDDTGHAVTLAAARALTGVELDALQRAISAGA